ncbi:MAG: TRAP transporter small permease subunit [Pseudomonadales bacterium]
MLPTLSFIVLQIDRFTTFTGRTLAPLLGLMLLVTVAVVVLRYGLNAGTQALQEIVVYLHATVFMLGFAYTLKADGHVRVDIFYQKLGDRGRAAVNCCGSTFLLLPMCGFIFFSSLDYVGFAWQLKEGSAEPGGLPFIYVLKTLIPASAALLFVQGTAELLRNLIVLLGDRRG